MSDATCLFCTLTRQLETAEAVTDPGSGATYRKIRAFPASVAVLGPDQFYRGYTLVIARTHARELYHLPEEESTRYFREMLAVARAIDAAFQPRKLNYELLGNTVPHLHWHLFPRHADDPAPLRPTWEHAHAPHLLTPAEAEETVARIRRALVA